MSRYLGKIEEFDLARDDWLLYIERLEQYFIANDIDGEKKKVAVLLSVMGGNAYGVLRSRTAPEKPANKSFTEIVQIMQDHLSSKQLQIDEQICFHEMPQNEGESIADNVAGRKILSERCQFGDGLDDALRDRSVCGIPNERMEIKLLREPDLTFHHAAQEAVSMEAEAGDGTALQTRDRAVSKINKESIEEVKMDHNNMHDCIDEDEVREMSEALLQEELLPAEMDPDNSWELIHEEEVQEIRLAIGEGDLTRAVEIIQKTLECLENTKLNIAVTGESGTGKSTFVNALRGVSDEDEGAAKTGVVETTMEPTAYSHPQYENVKYWDLPGIGTPNFKAEDYLRSVDFAKYDFFVIIASERFRECNIQLAKAIHDLKKNFYFVRSKIDVDMDAAQKRRPKTYNEAKILQDIRDDCINGFIKEDVKNPRVFLLDLMNCKYDFDLLQETLEKELPMHKRYAFLFSLPNISLPVLTRKREALLQQLWKKSAVSCAIATLPIPGLAITCDVTILVKTMKEYQRAFGLDESSLCRLSKLSGKSITDLKSVIKSPQSISEINKEIVIKMLTKGTMGAAMLAEQFISQVPVFGSLAAGGISYVTTNRMLKSFLYDSCDDAGRVLLKAAESDV